MRLGPPAPGRPDPHNAGRERTPRPSRGPRQARSVSDLRRPLAGARLARRSHWSGRMTHLLADLRLAARSLARAPLFTVVAVVSIALGIGANTAVFTLLDQVALRPLPIRSPDELVQIHARGEESYGGTMGNGTELSWPMLRDFQDKAPGFDGVVGRVSTLLHVGQSGVSERTDGELVSGNYFEVLGVEPAIGRLLTPADDDTDLRPRAGGARLRLLAPPLRRPRRRPRPGDSDQRPPVHRDWRRGPRLLRPRARAAGGRLRACHDAAAARPGLAQDRESPVPLGAGLRAAQAGREPRAGAGRAAAALQRHPPDGGAGDRLPARLGRDQGAVRQGEGPGRRRQPRTGGAALGDEPVARDPDGGRGGRAADRLRQPRQPADRPRRGARARAGAAAGTRRERAAPGVAADGGGRGARRGGQRVRPDLSRRGAPACSSTCSPPRTASRSSAPRPTGGSWRSRPPSPWPPRCSRASRRRCARSGAGSRPR